LLGGLDSPTKGTIIVNGKDISTLTANELADYRAATVGFVFQSYNLIPTLTVIENVALVKEIAPNPLSSHDMLDAVGLLDHKHNLPTELSGGEQQRVSIARALAKNPKILLCDEPTGALDSETGVMVLKLLLSMARDMGKTIIIVTHNQNIARMADVVVRVKNGKIQSCESQAAPLQWKRWIGDAAEKAVPDAVALQGAVHFYGHHDRPGCGRIPGVQHRMVQP
jgi:putative ABC transport system ATP-binding protein